MQDSFIKRHMLSNAIRSGVLIVMLFAIMIGLALGGLFIFHSSQNGWKLSAEIFALAADHTHLIAPYIIGGTLVWAIISGLLSDALISMGSGARNIDPDRHPRLRDITNELCRRAGMDVPRLAIIDTPVLNAYASGLTKGSYCVTVTKGLMKKLNDQELAGVIAHELAHIRHSDVRLLVLAGTVTGGIALVFGLFELMLRFGFMMFGSLLLGGEDMDDMDDGGEEEGGGFSALLAALACLPLIIIAWFISQLIAMAISRRREFLADAAAVEMTGNPQAMASALRKVCEDCDLDAPSAVRAMCIDSPRGLTDLFATHPATEDRLAALQNMRVMPGSYAGRQATPGTATPGAASSTPMAPIGTTNRPGANGGGRKSFGLR